MIKFIVFSTLLAYTLSAPTSDKEKPNENQSKSTFILRAQEKPILEHSQVGSGIFVNPPATDQRIKREHNAGLPPSDNKRSQINSQPDYQENKPPTFVHPIPVDQIIKNSHAAPQIHSAHKSDEVDNDDEEHKSIIDDDELTDEDQKSNEHYSTYKRAKTSAKTTKTIDESDSSDQRDRHENH